MFVERDLLPISALQHLLYCPRQCALIHLEQLWVENRLTAEGRQLHKRAHAADAGPRGRGLIEQARQPDGSTLVTVRGALLRCVRLGVFGVADVVEIVPRSEPALPADAPLTTERWAVRSAKPVEYKRGRPKSHDADRVQLCAQALCLEEMLNLTIPAGEIFYGKTRRRIEVLFDAALRAVTERTAHDLHALIHSGRTPAAVYERRKCDRCSLLPLCAPRSVTPSRNVPLYISRAMADPAPWDDPP
jgi:CRISPR-associated exonuclease Cas4